MGKKSKGKSKGLDKTKNQKTEADSKKVEITESGKNQHVNFDRLDLIILLVILLISMGLRVYGLSFPPKVYFDETHYVPAARDYLTPGRIDRNYIHPPLAKVIMAVFIKFFGDKPVVWRVPSVILGLVMIIFMYLLGLRMFKNRFGAAMAASLLAVEFLHITQSRIATLDIYIACFIFLGYYYAYMYFEDSPSIETGKRDVLRRPYKNVILSAIFFGFALSVKISAIGGVGGAFLYVVFKLWQEYHDKDSGFIKKTGEKFVNTLNMFAQLIKLSAIFTCVMVVVYVLIHIPIIIKDTSPMSLGDVKDWGKLSEQVRKKDNTAKVKIWENFSQESKNIFDNPKKDGSITLTGNSILNWDNLVGSLKNSQSPLVKRVYNHLSTSSRELIDSLPENNELSKKDKKTILNALNELIKRKDFYDKSVFGGIALSEDGKKLLSKTIEGLSDDEIEHFNRLILEAIFSEDIAKTYNEKDKEIIVADFNKMIKTKGFYQPEAFSGIQYWDQSKKLKDKGYENLSPKEMRRFHRLIIQTVYWDHIKYLDNDVKPKEWLTYERTFKFHYTDKFTHPYLSQMWQWPIVHRPIWYEYNKGKDGMIRGIVAIGSLLFWWSFIPVLLDMIYRAAMERDHRVVFILSGYLPLYLFWLSSMSTHGGHLHFKGGFFYYMLPCVPFMVLGLTETLNDLRDNKIGKVSIVIYSLGIIAFLIFFYPILVGIPISQKYYDYIMKLNIFKNWV